MLPSSNWNSKFWNLEYVWIKSTYNQTMFAPKIITNSRYSKLDMLLSLNLKNIYETPPKIEKCEKN